jgi:hypothetical protein
MFGKDFMIGLPPAHNLEQRNAEILTGWLYVSYRLVLQVSDSPMTEIWYLLARSYSIMQNLATLTILVNDWTEAVRVPQQPVEISRSLR